jgi:hypothetical protein
MPSSPDLPTLLARHGPLAWRAAYRLLANRSGFFGIAAIVLAYTYFRITLTMGSSALLR